MQCLSWCAPILPGQTDAWKAFDATMRGARRAEHEESRRRMGVHREVVSLLSTPQGDVVCLFHEADDIESAFRTLATSTDPYDVWFRERLIELHGLTPDMLQGPPPAILHFDFRAKVATASVPAPAVVTLDAPQRVG